MLLLEETIINIADGTSQKEMKTLTLPHQKAEVCDITDILYARECGRSQTSGLKGQLIRQ